MSVASWEAWAVYLIASFGLIACLWYITWPFYAWIKHPLRTCSIVFLLMPWTVAADIQLLSPAWLTALFDGLLKEDVTFTRAGFPLLAALVLALLLSLAATLVFQRKQTTSLATSKDEV